MLPSIWNFSNSTFLKILTLQNWFYFKIRIQNTLNQLSGYLLCPDYIGTLDMNEYFYKFPLQDKIYIHGLYRDLRYMNEYFSKSKVYILVFYLNLRYIIMHGLACCWRVPRLVSLKYSQPLNLSSNFPYKVYIYRF